MSSPRSDAPLAMDREATVSIVRGFYDGVSPWVVQLQKNRTCHHVSTTIVVNIAFQIVLAEFCSVNINMIGGLSSPFVEDVRPRAKDGRGLFGEHGLL